MRAWDGLCVFVRTPVCRVLIFPTHILMPPFFRRRTLSRHISAVGFSKAMSMMIGLSVDGEKRQPAWRMSGGRVDLLCVRISRNHECFPSFEFTSHHRPYVSIRSSFTNHILPASSGVIATRRPMSPRQYFTHIRLIRRHHFQVWSLDGQLTRSNGGLRSCIHKHRNLIKSYACGRKSETTFTA